MIELSGVKSLIWAWFCNILFVQGTNVKNMIKKIKVFAADLLRHMVVLKFSEGNWIKRKDLQQMKGKRKRKRKKEEKNCTKEKGTHEKVKKVK